MINEASVIILIFLAALCIDAENNKSELDSLYRKEIEATKEPIKILYSAPFYLDLIRDLRTKALDSSFTFLSPIFQQNNHRSLSL